MKGKKLERGELFGGVILNTNSAMTLIYHAVLAK